MGRERPVSNERYRARSRINMRIGRGTLRRGDCVVCGAPDAEAHHPDYSRPLWISWLCKGHHAALHAGRLCLLPAAVVQLPGE